MSKTRTERSRFRKTKTHHQLWAKKIPLNASVAGGTLPPRREQGGCRPPAPRETLGANPVPSWTSGTREVEFDSSSRRIRPDLPPSSTDHYATPEKLPASPPAAERSHPGTSTTYKSRPLGMM